MLNEEGARPARNASPPVSLDRKGLLLLVLALSGGKALTPVQLQKAVFLIQERVNGLNLSDSKFRFVPHNYGPFSGDVYDVARDVSISGLVRIVPSPGDSFDSYSVTPNGFQLGQDIAHKLDMPQRDLAERIVAWVCAQSFDSLVSSIYKAYPAYRVNSIFQER